MRGWHLLQVLALAENWYVASLEILVINEYTIRPKEQRILPDVPHVNFAYANLSMYSGMRYSLPSYFCSVLYQRLAYGTLESGDIRCLTREECRCTHGCARYTCKNKKGSLDPRKMDLATFHDRIADDLNRKWKSDNNSKSYKRISLA